MERNIVFCCDGTGNQKGTVNTNVVHLLRRIPTHNHQIIAYEPGVGTFSPFGLPRDNRIGTTLGKLFGHGLTANIENGYRFLMQHYREGDRVYLFGFSRGAYAVRALSGMLEQCGLLHPGQEDRVPQATHLYTRQNNLQEAAAFRSRHTRPCPVHFIGAWDTVGSLGYLYRNRRFFDTKLSPRVTHACHALAIDERRPKFEPLLWDKTHAEPHQTVEQLWFPGAHADVGGGYPKRQLAEIALQWMLQRAEHAGLQIIENHDPATAPDPAGPIHEPWNTWPGRALRWLHLGDRPREVPPEACTRPQKHATKPSDTGQTSLPRRPSPQAASRTIRCGQCAAGHALASVRHTDIRRRFTVPGFAQSQRDKRPASFRYKPASYIPGPHADAPSRP